MGKEEVVIEPSTDLEQFGEKLKSLENRIQLLEILTAKQVSEEPRVEPKVEPKMKKLIQINVKPTVRRVKGKGGLPTDILVKEGRTYFCETQQEQRLFLENNPGVETETFNIEMPDYIAAKRLNAPENKKQFERN